MNQRLEVAVVEEQIQVLVRLKYLPSLCKYVMNELHLFDSLFFVRHPFIFSLLSNFCRILRENSFLHSVARGRFCQPNDPTLEQILGRVSAVWMPAHQL
jgi:hypothetical protein